MSGYSKRPDRDDSDVVGARIGAQIIDSLVMFAIFFGVFLFFSAMGGATGSSETAGGFGALGLLIGIVGSLFYGFLLEGYWDGYTVGKKVFGIKVVKEDGGSCGYSGAFLRNILEIIDGLFYYVVGFIFMASGDKRQRLGDRIAGTVVVSETPHGTSKTTEASAGVESEPAP